MTLVQTVQFGGLAAEVQGLVFSATKAGKLSEAVDLLIQNKISPAECASTLRKICESKKSAAKGVAQVDESLEEVILKLTNGERRHEDYFHYTAALRAAGISIEPDSTVDVWLQIYETMYSDKKN